MRCSITTTTAQTIEKIQQ